MTQPNKYKKTNIPWMEKIPVHWEVRRLKVLGKISTSSVDKKVKEGDKIVYLVNYTDVYGNKDKEIWNNPKYMKVSANPTQIVVSDLKKGDILFTPSSETIEDIGICSVVMENLENTLYSYHLVRLRFYEDKIYNNYKKYMFNNPYVQSYFSMLAKGSTRKILDLGNFKNLLIPIPSIEEQTAIANYLDKKCKEIKTFITKKQTFIKLLKEQRQSVIDVMVSGKLLIINGKTQKPTKTKDSGIDWLGDIPEHWEVRRLKFTSNITYGVSPNEKTYNDKGIGSILINGPVEYSKKDFGITRSLKWTTQPQKFAKKGSLLFCLRGSTTGRLNICHTDVSIGRGVAAIMGVLFSQEYLSFVMMAMRKSIEYSFKGSTFPSVNSGVLNNYYVAVPSKTEQSQIITHIKTETSKIDQAISRAEKEIELIQEYQKAMIAEAVLGVVSV